MFALRSFSSISPLMSLRFQVLASGSSGNTAVVSTEVAPGDLFDIIIDAGLPWLHFQRRAPTARPRALLITHEHSDHIRYAAEIAQKLSIPIYATAGTAQALRGVDLRRLEAGRSVHIGPIEVRPFATPHDARESVGFVLRSGGASLGWATDLGEATQTVAESLSDCDAMLLEFNHDPEMLWRGRYPWPVKKRVGGPLGHLSNPQAAALLQTIVAKGRLKLAVLAHLSESNNTPALAFAAAQQATGNRNTKIALASAKEPTDSFTVVGPATQLALL